jgi:hypothetical protein
VVPEILKTSGVPRNTLMYLSSFLHPHTKHKILFYAFTKTRVHLVGNEILLVTLLKATVSYIKPEDGNGKGKLISLLH